MMIRTIYLFLCGLFFHTSTILSQAPDNDLCSQARIIHVGEKLEQLHNAEAGTTKSETPLGIPETCVKSFENDVWFKFTTVAAYTHYKVVVNPLDCDTPAGLQAMLIRADDCNADNFEYKSCLNPREEQQLRMFLEEPQSGLDFFIYVDGYDGTVCGFTLELIGENENKQTIADYKRQEIDYDHKNLTIYEPSDINLKFLNNEAHIQWQDDTQSDAILFQVQRYYENPYYSFGRIIANIDAQKTVDIGLATYNFIDNVRFKEGENYCYKVIKIDSEGNKSYTEPICVEATMVKDLFVSQIVPASEAGKYLFKYINNRKQDLVFRVLDIDYQELKSLVKKKEPKQEGNVTIDMSLYESGVYYLKAECKEGHFLRKFVVE